MAEQGKNGGCFTCKYATDEGVIWCSYGAVKPGDYEIIAPPDGRPFGGCEHWEEAEG